MFYAFDHQSEGSFCERSARLHAGGRVKLVQQVVVGQESGAPLVGALICRTAAGHELRISAGTRSASRYDSRFSRA